MRFEKTDYWIGAFLFLVFLYLAWQVGRAR